MKGSILHNKSTSRQHLLRILVGLTSIFGLKLFSVDLTQAFLQSAEIFSVLSMSNQQRNYDEMFAILLKALFGLSDRGDYWRRIIFKHINSDLRID